MTDTTLPTHEAAEKVFTDHVEPLLKQLPDCIESREAKRLQEITADLVHQSLEKAPRDR